MTTKPGLSHAFEKYCGIINVGPFGCLQTLIAEAVSIPEMNKESKVKIKKSLGKNYTIPEGLTESSVIPFLTIECDGMGFPQIIESRLETFTLQAERVARIMQNHT